MFKKKGLVSFLAGAAAFYLLFLNLFPLAAYAASGAWNIPAWNSESWESESWKAESWENESWKSESWETGPRNTEPWITEQWDIQPGEHDRHNPGITPVNPGYGFLPLQPPGEVMPPNAEVQNPGSPDKEYWEPGMPSAKEFNDFLYNGIVKSTINHGDQLGDMRQFFRDPNLQSRYLMSTFKLIGANNESIKAIPDGYSVVMDYKEGYGRYKELAYFLNPTSYNFGSHQTLANVENSFSAINNANGVFKTVSRFNIAAASIGAVFSAADTIDNFSKGETLNGLNSLGSFLIDAGTIGMAIPAAQPIAAGAIVLGGVLAAGTGAVKLYRNRKKIAADAKKIWNSTVRAATTIKKGITDGLKSLFSN
ncbi:hypothetical protein [Bacillus marinisedimentorum]|uniref:hypothetical protein n=1 Tax=Bacillus marinisedimentorum TaxID=1821260 RepID=UPI0008732DA7|nr:hypothetical protein [Bacillus marinisedimentorum]